MNSIKSLTCLLFFFLCTCSLAQTKSDEVDSVEISLLTCSPHEEIYSLYGHTALRIHDTSHDGNDVAVNWGMFSFGDGSFGMLEFSLRFMFGLTDYTIAIEPFDEFCYQYRYYGSSVTEQVLNLTDEEKKKILAAITENYKPENRVYRYNYFYDNCTTRAIDMVLNNIGTSSEGRRLRKTDENKENASFRDMIHACNSHHPWAALGNDMLLGVAADQPTNKREWLFLPSHAMQDFAKMSIIGTQEGPLVKETNVVVAPGNQTVEKEFPLTPRQTFLVLFAITVFVTVIEVFSKKSMWGYDLILMVACGLAGIILFLMVFSEQPTVRVNLQLLLLNPLPLFFIKRMIHRTRNKQADRQYLLWIALIVLFYVGGCWQQYAEGMTFVASSLLLRNTWCHIRQLKYSINNHK